MYPHTTSTTDTEAGCERHDACGTRLSTDNGRPYCPRCLVYLDGHTQAQAPELHVVVAQLATGERLRCSAPLAWDTAQAMWRRLDDMRLKGHMPHVAWYAVRGDNDPGWQVPLSQRPLCPHPDQPLPKARPTSHQAGVLARLVRRSTGGLAPQRVAGVLISSNELRWVLDSNCGGPMALHHLWAKGYAERDVRTGPRGGEHVYYRPTMAGVAYAARQQARQAA